MAALNDPSAEAPAQAHAQAQIAPARLVVYTSDPTYSVRKGIAEINAAMPGLQWLILCHVPAKPLRQLLRNQWRNLRANGWRWIPYQIGDIWQRLFGAAGHPVRAQDPGYAYTAAGLAALPNVTIRRCQSIHADDAIQAVRAFAPTLGLSLAAPILREPLFSLPERGTINLHKGRLPDYRGMPPAFWELWNDEPAVGCSIHSVDAKLDTGALVKAATLPRQKFASVKAMQLQLDELGVALMREAVIERLQGAGQGLPQPAGGRTYRKPTLGQISTLDRRLQALEPATTSAAKRIVRNTLATTAHAAWRAGARGLLAPRITVVLFHRITDEVRDNLTVGIAQFDRQMALLRRHCQPISLHEVLADAPVPRTGKPLVAVTFDDGYLDNHSHAAPILLRHGIPAAFFVSTGIVHTTRPFPHDVRRGNAPIPTMNWDQIRQLREWGFTVGSHSVNHIDCAAESEDTVRQELLQSKADLKREIDLDAPIFAYPYGGRQHMSAPRLALVKQCGYSACLSAYGGSNIGRVDPFNVLRQGIHWEFSDQAFLLACLGIR